MQIEVNNVSLFYERSGQGAPLILLHGSGESHHIFDRIIPKLSPDYTVYAVDSRNHGESGHTGIYSYDVMVEDIYSFIKALNLERVRLIGFSDGAITGLLLALRHPGILDMMVLMGVNLKPEDFTDEAYGCVKENYERTKDPLFKLMLEEPHIDITELAKIEIPVLVVGGEHDIYRTDMFSKVAQALPRGRLRIMAGHDHESYIVNSDILYPDIKAFFGE